jgi:hypothetical protein
MFRIGDGNKRRKDGTEAVRRRPRLRPTLMQLEGRTLLSTFTVDSMADNGSAGTLRWAIAQANASNQASTIVFACVLTTPEAITLTGGPLVVTNRATTTIIGPGDNLLAVSGNRASRVFEIDGGSVAISDLTIAGGRVNGNGGGVENNGGDLTLTNVILRDNSARDGGGLFNNGSATLTDVIVRGNHAREGGGLFNNGSATLTDVVLRGNHARVGARFFSARAATLDWRGLSSPAATGQILFDNFPGTGHVPKNWMQILGQNGDIKEMPKNLTITDSTGNFAGIASTLPSSVFSPLGVATTSTAVINKVNANGNAVVGLFGLNGDGYLAASLDAKGVVDIILQQNSPSIPTTIVKIGNGNAPYTGGQTQMSFIINALTVGKEFVEVKVGTWDSGKVYLSTLSKDFSLAAAFKDGAVPALVGASQPTSKGGSASFASILVGTSTVGRRR